MSLTMVLNSDTSWRKERLTRRNELLRVTESDFRLLLPTRWRLESGTFREDLEIYPISFYYVLQCMAFLQWADVRDKLLKDIEDWRSWPLKRCLVEFEKFRSPVVTILKRVEILACTGPQKHISTFAIWSRIIRRAMNQDTEDLEESVICAIKTQELTPSSFDFWEVRSVMDIILTLIRRRNSSKRFLIRFLNKMVEKTGVIPDCMILTGLRRQGEYPIGGGGFADVWQGLLGDEVVALKVLRVFQRTSYKSLENTSREFRKECMIWRQLCHPNILPLFGIDENTFRPRLAMVSPWMSNGNVITYLEENEDVDRLELINGVALGLRYLHAQTPPVVHGDLRGSNILIDDEGEPRIADFGLSRILDSKLNKMDSTSFRANGSMRWQSPELLDSELFPDVKPGISTASDVYSFACVCLEIFTEEAPFPHLRRDVEILSEVVMHRRPHPRPSGDAIKRGLSDDIWLLMTECWSRQPSERPVMRDVVRSLDIQEGGALADGTSSNTLDVDVLSPPTSLIMTTPLYSELVRLASALKIKEQNDSENYNEKLRGAVDLIDTVEKRAIVPPDFKFKNIGAKVSPQEASEFNTLLHQMSEVAIGLRSLLPDLHILGLSDASDIKFIIRMARTLTRQQDLLMLPAAPYILNVEDLKKATGQVPIFIEKATTCLFRRLNRVICHRESGSPVPSNIPASSEVKAPKATLLQGNSETSNQRCRTISSDAEDKDNIPESVKRKRSNSQETLHGIENISPKRTKCE